MDRMLRPLKNDHKIKIFYRVPNYYCLMARHVLIALTSLSDSSTITEENRQFLAQLISPGHFWHHKFHLMMVYQLTHFVKFVFKGWLYPHSLRAT